MPQLDGVTAGGARGSTPLLRRSLQSTADAPWRPHELVVRSSVQRWRRDGEHDVDLCPPFVQVRSVKADRGHFASSGPSGDVPCSVVIIKIVNTDTTPPAAIASGPAEPMPVGPQASRPCSG